MEQVGEFEGEKSKLQIDREKTCKTTLKGGRRAQRNE